MPPSQLEQQRASRIADNKRRMQELGLDAAAEEAKKHAAGARKPAQKRKRGGEGDPEAAAPAEPPRRSGRQRKDVSYTEPRLADVLASAPTEAAREPLPTYNPPADPPAAQVAPSFDPREGRRDAQGRLVFADRPDFRPNLTPKQVIQAGSFGGIYFNPVGGKPGILGGRVDIDYKEFPTDWFEGLPTKAYRARVYTVGRNKYGVKAGQDQAFWEEKGWIDPQDPRGWFHWYCRFYSGRRSKDDERQISRWKGVVGDKGRWVRALVNKIVRSNKRWDDATVSPVIRQTLLHWAFELTEEEFERMLNEIL